MRTHSHPSSTNETDIYFEYGRGKLRLGQLGENVTTYAINRAIQAVCRVPHLAGNGVGSSGWDSSEKMLRHTPSNRAIQAVSRVHHLAGTLNNRIYRKNQPKRIQSSLIPRARTRKLRHVGSNTILISKSLTSAGPSVASCRNAMRFEMHGF